MSDPNIAEKYYGKLKTQGEETIADFVWNQALEIKQLQATNQQLVEALIDAEEKLSILGFYEPEISEAILNAKQQEVN